MEQADFDPWASAIWVELVLKKRCALFPQYAGTVRCIFDATLLNPHQTRDGK